MASNPVPYQTTYSLHGFQGSLNTYPDQEDLFVSSPENTIPPPSTVHDDATNDDYVRLPLPQLPTGCSTSSELTATFDSNTNHFSAALVSDGRLWPVRLGGLQSCHEVLPAMYPPMTTHDLTEQMETTMAMVACREPEWSGDGPSDDTNAVEDTPRQGHRQKGNEAFGFPCSACGKMFNRSCDLNTHHKKHSKPYVCGVCSRGFSSNKDRKRHELAHNPTMKFRCLSAGCAFETTRKDSFQRHAYNQHMEVVPA